MPSRPRRKSKTIALLVLVASVVGENSSFASEQTLQLREVLGTTRFYYPKAQAMAQEVEKARAKQTSARGNLDLKLSAKGQLQPTGFYQSSEVLTGLEQPTTLWGTSFFAGWRRSHGQFPSYEGKRVTGTGGELLAGFNVPVLRGGLTDEGRTEISQAEAQVRFADAAYNTTLLNALEQASLKYWKWVEASQKLKILTSLLQAAEDRQVWILTRVKLGDLPAVEAVDNQRSILDRKTKVINARQDLMTAALELSMYYRDALGNPILVTSQRAPEAFPPAREFFENELDQHTEKARQLRPEFKGIKAQFDAIDAEVSLAQTQMLPTLDLFGEASRDLGTVDATRQGTELKTGVVVKIPLERRKARGRRAAARANRMKLSREAQLMQDRLRIALAQQLARLRATYEQIQIATQEVDVNTKLVEGERIRFKQGDSNIMFVNIRELNLGASRIRLLRARSNHQQNRASLLAITGELAGSPDPTE